MERLNFLFDIAFLALTLTPRADSFAESLMILLKLLIVDLPG